MALKKLESQHLLAIKYMAIPKRGGLTYAQVAEKCNVHENSLYNWKKDPLFERELKKEIVRQSLDRLPEIFESIPDHIIKEGNAAMLKTFLQTHDMLTDKVEVTNGDDKSEVDVNDIRERAKKLREEGDKE